MDGALVRAVAACKMGVFMNAIAMCMAIVVAIAIAHLIVRAVVRRRHPVLGKKQAGVGPYECDPTSCNHSWKAYDVGTCMHGYSSYGGPDPQAQWKVEYCPHCGARFFTCSETGCADYETCREIYERGAS